MERTQCLLFSLSQNVTYPSKLPPYLFVLSQTARAMKTVPFPALLHENKTEKHLVAESQVFIQTDTMKVDQKSNDPFVKIRKVLCLVNSAASRHHYYKDCQKCRSWSVLPGPVSQKSLDSSGLIRDDTIPLATARALQSTTNYFTSFVTWRIVLSRPEYIWNEI